MAEMFAAASFNRDINKWDVSAVIDMSYMFSACSQYWSPWSSTCRDFVEFKGTIANWDVSAVKDMRSMFRGSDFNGDISKWDVSAVHDMERMFRESNFRGDISKWDVSAVNNMRGMFRESNFNGDISKWDVSVVNSMHSMFWEASFNGNIANWDVSAVLDMQYMFTRSALDPGPRGWRLTREALIQLVPLCFRSMLAACTAVEFADVSSITDMSSVFRLRSFTDRRYSHPVDISRWNVASVTDMSYMFYGSSFNGDLSKWNVAAVQDMSYMFGTFAESFCSSNCQPSHFNRDLSNWDVSAVQNMRHMFQGAAWSWDISRWNTSAVTDMSFMFAGVPQTPFDSSFNGNISAWDVSSVTDMSRMFEMSSFNGDISRWDTSSVTTMEQMFSYAWFNRDISKWDVAAVNDMAGMFWYASFNQDLSTWEVSAVNDMSSMFRHSTFDGDLSKWDVSSGKSMSEMFSYASFNGNIANWDVSKVETMQSMFQGASFNGDISRWNTGAVTDMSFMFEGGWDGSQRILSPFNGNISRWDVSSVTDMSHMFESSFFNGNLAGWDVSAVTTMVSMFEYAMFNEHIADWDVSAVNDMSRMFWGAAASFKGDVSRWPIHSPNVQQGFESNFGSLPACVIAPVPAPLCSNYFCSLQLKCLVNSCIAVVPKFFGEVCGSMTSWDTSRVGLMSALFENVVDFNADLSSWDTSSVLYMDNLFSGASTFNGDISRWNTSKVKSMSGMFRAGTDETSSSCQCTFTQCSSPKKEDCTRQCANHAFNRDISRWDTGAVIDMSGMFACHASYNGDLSAWDTSSVTNMRNMFAGANAFNRDISAWNTGAVTDMNGLFRACAADGSDCGCWEYGCKEDGSECKTACVETAFNWNVMEWDVRSVVDMGQMFFHSSSFDHDLCLWRISGVDNVFHAFAGTRNMKRFCDCTALPGRYCIQGLTNRSGTICPAGRYCSGGQSQPRICSASPGKYCPAGTSSATGSLCPTGSFCSGGSSAPTSCGQGFFQDTRGGADCVPCPVGTSSLEIGATNRSTCRPCAPGAFVNASGSAVCRRCAAGTYQSEAGARSCQPCKAGAYCPEGSAAALVCPSGTFSTATDLESRRDCEDCPAGHACTAGSQEPTPCPPGSYAASKGSDSCTPCLAGFHNGQPKQHECLVCEAGTFCPTGSLNVTECSPGSFGASNASSACDTCRPGSYSKAGATACTACELGKYADNFGQGFCIPCPHPLSSASGSVLCAVCREGFFLSDSTASPTDIFISPDAYCTTCPPKVQCGPNVSLETLPIPAGSWRDGKKSSRIYACFVNESGYSPCRGSTRRSDSGITETGEYCIPGHRGPLCQVCVESTKFYETFSGLCLECSKSSKLGRFLGALLGAVACLLLCYVASRKLQAFRKLIHFVASVAGTVGILAKAKILISFYQVFNTLGDVYGVRLHRHFTGWLDFIAVFDAPAAEFMLPGKCVGSMQARLALNSLWPVAVVGVVVACIGAFGVVQRLYSSDNRHAETWSTRSRAGNATIFILFLVLPNVSRSIFSAKQCVSFEVSDSPPKSRSYLLADMAISCTSSEFSSLNAYFWTFFVMWPVLVPLTGLGLVLSIQKSVSAQRYSKLANACRFLWRDYETSFLFWEIVDMLRKIFLTALILFVDTEYGEVRLLRLWLAAFVSAGFLALLALARPYKRTEDLYLACTSNLLLTCCFLSGIAIKLCEDQAWAHECEQFLGLGGSYQTNVFVVAITAAMLALSLGVILVKTLMTILTGTIRVVATGREPVLELPTGCAFHCFLSHTWRTGQDQTHTIARQLQLLLPEIKVWLDVDNLNDVGKLEESVRACAVFVIFLSAGYFRSPSCQRELRTALAEGKPIVAVREADKEKGGATVHDLQQECEECCAEQAEEVVQRVFTEEPVVWVRVHDFQMESLKLIVSRVLPNLPYYTTSPQELEKGLTVAGELRPFVMDRPVVLLACNENAGAQRVAEELRAAAAPSAHFLRIQAADDVLNQEPKDKKVMLMLYLNNRTFLDVDNKVGKLVKNAIERKIPIVPVHEQDAEAGGCAFGEIYDRTPEELLRPPYMLWDTLAIPLFPAAAHRKISIRHILRSMGAKPLRRVRAHSNHAVHAGALTSIAATGDGETEGRLADEQPLSTVGLLAPADLSFSMSVGAPQQFHMAAAETPNTAEIVYAGEWHGPPDHAGPASAVGGARSALPAGTAAHLQASQAN